jgi:hypothetical protein
MQTYDANYLNLTDNMLKNIFKASCCRLMYHLPLEAFACLEVCPLGHDGSVLLSIVDQVLLCNFLCVGSSSYLLPVKLLMTVSGKSMPLCARFHTEARRRYRVAEGGLHL